MPLAPTTLRELRAVTLLLGCGLRRGAALGLALEFHSSAGGTMGSKSTPWFDEPG